MTEVRLRSKIAFFSEHRRGGRVRLRSKCLPLGSKLRIGAGGDIRLCSKIVFFSDHRCAGSVCLSNLFLHRHRQQN